jgi:multidrug efflux pump
MSGRVRVCPERGGEKVPFLALTQTDWTGRPFKREGYNGAAAVNIQGSAGPGTSSGQALPEWSSLLLNCREASSSEWTNLSYQERLPGSQPPYSMRYRC